MFVAIKIQGGSFLSNRDTTIYSLTQCVNYKRGGVEQWGHSSFGRENPPAIGNSFWILLAVQI